MKLSEAVEILVRSVQGWNGQTLAEDLKGGLILTGLEWDPEEPELPPRLKVVAAPWAGTMEVLQLEPVWPDNATTYVVWTPAQRRAAYEAAVAAYNREREAESDVFSTETFVRAERARCATILKQVLAYVGRLKPGPVSGWVSEWLAEARRKIESGEEASAGWLRCVAMAEDQVPSFGVGGLAYDAGLLQADPPPPEADRERLDPFIGLDPAPEPSRECREVKSVLMELPPKQAGPVIVGMMPVEPSTDWICIFRDGDQLLVESRLLRGMEYVESVSPETSREWPERLVRKTISRDEALHGAGLNLSVSFLVPSEEDFFWTIEKRDRVYDEAARRWEAEPKLRERIQEAIEYLISERVHNDRRVVVHDLERILTVF